MIKLTVLHLRCAVLPTETLTLGDPRISIEGTRLFPVGLGRIKREPENIEKNVFRKWMNVGPKGLGG